MADFSALKTAIQAYIRTNGNEEITGAILQDILLSVVTTMGDGAINALSEALQAEITNRQNAVGGEATTRAEADSQLSGRINAEAQARGDADTQLGNSITAITTRLNEGYVYAGIATPSTNPGTPAGKVFYIALQAGTYTNFSSLAVTQGITILKYDGTAWSQEQLVGIDDVPTKESNKLVKSGGVFANIGAFDISEYHKSGSTLATYADLTAALAALPSDFQKGGMSIKFVQSSDNKYVQYRLMSDEFTTDTTQWAIANEGVYVENPEFVYVKTDNDNKILWAIKTDGGIYYGAGVPQQVIDYVEEKIADLSLDEYEDIVAFLDDLEKGDETLQDLLDKKVDGEYEENPEFIEAKIDAENKVLEGIQNDGTKVIGGDIRVLGNMEVSGVSYKVIENPEYLAAWVDAEDKVIFGLKTDGKTYVGDADFLNDIENIKAFLANITDKNIDWDALSSITAVENSEYIEAKTDSEGKLLAGRTPDGAAFENVGLSTPNVSIDGHIIENIEDPEGRSEVTTDSEDKIISYRDSDGVKHEEVGIESENITTNSLNLSEEGMTEFQQALKDAGFQPGGGGDWSDREDIELPEPEHYSLLNIVVESLPVNDEDVSEGYVMYYDGFGNYFRMTCELAAQGQTSRIFAMTGGKGNYTLDLPKDVKFGSWVPQDSFHLKGNYKDATRGILPTSYKWAYEFMDYLDAKPNRVLMDEDAITTTEATGDRITDWPSDARCLPDGFPVEIYINGEYWGLYSWQLKKHRKNYSMDKKDYTSFFLDADALMTGDYTTGIWNEGPKRWWNSFEIKNPKDMILENGQDYDDHGELIGPLFSVFDSTNWKYTDDYSTSEPVSDIWNAGTNYAVDDECWCYDEEIEWWRKFKAIAANQNRPPLSFSTNTNYDASNKKHKGSARTKSIIQSFAKKYLEVKGLIDANDIVNAKAKFNEYFDYNCCMLVYIFNCLMDNEDSVKKNTLWATYGDGKIAPMLWDLDGMYGHGWMGLVVREPRNGMWDNIYANANWPLKLLWTLYEDEIKAAYADLRRDGIIDMKAWKGIMYGQWVNRVGENALKRDIERWPETPSYRDSGINKDYWRAGGWTEDTNTDPIWDANTQYEIGDVVLLDIQPDIDIPNHHYYQKYTAKQQNTGECPVTKTYEHFPQIGGMYDSPKRMEKWMEEQIRVCDVKLGYNNI